MNKTTYVRMPQSLWLQLRALQKRENRGSLSNMIVHACRKYVAKHKPSLDELKPEEKKR